jgi:hypothetical protein
MLHVRYATRNFALAMVVDRTSSITRKQKKKNKKKLAVQYKASNNSISNYLSKGRAIAEALVTGFPPRRPGFAPGSGKWDMWWAKWRRGRFSPSTSVYPAKTISFHQLLHPHNHPEEVQ